MSECSYKIRKKMNKTIDRMKVLISWKETGGRRIINFRKKVLVNNYRNCVELNTKRKFYKNYQ